MDARDRAVVQFAGSLLRRALSESFAGVPVQEGEPQPLMGPNDVQQKHKLALAVRSLSLELARQRNKRQQSVRNLFLLLFYLFYFIVFFFKLSLTLQRRLKPKFRKME